MQSIVNFLKKHEIFSTIDSKYINKLAPFFELKKYKLGELLAIEGSSADKFLILVEGIIRCFSSTINGNTQTFFILFNNSLIYTDFINKTKYSYNIEALSHTIILSLNRQYFRKYVGNNINFMQSLLKYTACNLCKEVKEIKINAELKAKERIIYYFLKKFILKKTNLNLTEDGYINIKLKVSKSILASILNITPETLSRALKNLSNMKIIKSKKNNFYLNILIMQKYCNLLHNSTECYQICKTCNIKNHIN